MRLRLDSEAMTAIWVSHVTIKFGFSLLNSHPEIDFRIDIDLDLDIDIDIEREHEREVKMW